MRVVFGSSHRVKSEDFEAVAWVFGRELAGDEAAS